MAQTVATYTTPGSYTFTVPTGVTSVTVETWGAGGRGSTRTLTNNGPGGGGGGGGYSKSVFAVTGGSSYTVVVGAGSTTTSAGGNSSFSNGTVTVLANGGSSVADNQNSGANGGAVGTGNVITLAGGKGASGVSNNYGGGGGSSAGTALAGVTATNASGATAPTGGGNGGNGFSSTTTSGSGAAGTVPGGGGGGSIRYGSTGTSTGGAGANGKVVLTYGIAEINMFSSDGTNVPDGSAASASLGTQFGSVNTGSFLTAEFIIVNTGNIPLTLSAPSITGTNASEFTVITSPGTSVAAGSSATLVIKFLPTGTGTRTASISYATNDADENPFNFDLSGTGTAPVVAVTGGPAPTSIPNNDTTPSAAKGSDFGNQVTAGYVVRTFTINNTGTGMLTISGITFTGTNAADFSMVKTPSTTVAVGGSTTFSVKFAPTTGTTKTATVNIASDAGTYKFDVKGSYVSSTAADVSIYSSTPTEIPMYAAASTTYNTDFGSINTLDGAITKTFTIKNDSSTLLQTLTGVTVAVSGSGFSVSASTIPIAPLNVINPGSSATFTIQFDPTVAGTVNGTVTVTTSDANEGSYVFYVTGTGTNPEIAVFGGNPSTSMTDNATASTTNGTSFGTQFTTGYITREFSITNSGNGPLVISSVTNSNTTDYSTSLTAQTIAAGATVTFTITYDPGASSTGTRTGIITINNNDTDENPFEINLTGVVGTNTAEINVKGGSPLTDINNFAAASTTTGTNFGGIYVTSGSISQSYTIYNTGNAALSVSSTTITGTHASDFTITTTPATSVAAGGSTTLTIKFDPSGTGTRTATVTINNGDPNEGTYVFYITGQGNTYADTDGDGVTDDDDIDDDNDGIIDSLEQTACATVTNVTTNKVFLNETFGTGTARALINTNNADATTTYTSAATSLDDSYYTVFNSAQITTWANDYWYKGGDHTGNTNGMMALFNADFVPGKFYTNTISGTLPNVQVTFSFWAVNLDRADAPGIDTRNRPNVRVEIRKTSDNTLITSIQTGDIAPSPSGTATSANWNYYSTTFTTPATEFKVIFVNNAPGGLGNDIAIDDIIVSQNYCDMDSDGKADIFDLDDDDDGIPDIVEAGFQNLSNKSSQMWRGTSPSLWTDTNKNGLNDAADPTIISNYYTAYVQDTDGDGIYNFMDLDSDNDTIFDIDEANADTFYTSNTGTSYNGDGDIDGDGTGDGVDADDDGLLDLNDDLTSAYGTTNKAYPVDSDGDGIPNYLDLTSNGTTKDFDGTIYKIINPSLDANGDGKVDSTTDVDRDGIMDSFDSVSVANSVASIGSPRNITGQNLLIDFDGRNDYAEGAQLLSGASKVTLMGWLKLDANYPTAQTIVLGQDNFYISVGSDKKVLAYASTASMNYTATYATALSVSRWYHVAAVYDSAGSLRLYVNGTLVATTAATGALATSTNKFTIAKKSGALTNYFRGYIDEVRVFTDALTADQVQKMVYQKISQNGTAIRGAVIPKDIESSTWANLKAYYRLDDYKNNVTDDLTIAGTDDSATNTAFCRIYNVKYLKAENTPLPFVTKQDGVLNSTALTDATNFINGPDITDNNFAIVQVKHNVSLTTNFNNLGLIVDAGKTLTVSNDTKVENSWYLNLQGKIDLVGASQLVQGANSDLASTTTGSIERDQQGTKIKYNYNYWSSPVSTISNSTVNNGYTVAGVMKDGTTVSNPQNITWTTGLDGSPTTPITLSSSWIYKYQNLSIAYANWTFAGENGALAAGQGFTLKGPGSAGSNQNYVFVGKPNNGTITSPVSANNLNLSGNPYPSAISATEFIKDNLPTSSASANPGSSGALTGSLYFWQHSTTNNSHVFASYVGGYAAYTLVGGVAPITAPTGTSGNVGTANAVPKDYIPVGQAFFVQGSTTGGNITFKNSQRAFVKETASNSQIMMRSANGIQDAGDINDNTPLPNSNENAPKIRVGFNNNINKHRQVLIGFMGQNATDGFDLGYDAANFDSNPSDMYFHTADGNLLVQGVGEFTNAAVYPLGVTSDTSSPVSFTLDEVENLDENQAIFIFDALDNSYHNIKEGSYDTTIDAGTFNERFSLRFMNPLGVDNPTIDDKINVVFTNADNILNIKNTLLSTTVKSATLFNILGQQIATWNVDDQNQEDIQIPVRNVSTGTYIVKVQTNNGTVSKKIMVK